MRRRALITMMAMLAVVVTGARSATGASSLAAPPEPKFKVGDTAPDFTLPDQNGNKVSLSNFRGKKNVVLAFYIFAFSSG